MAESEPTRPQSGLILGPRVPIKTLPGVLVSPFPERRTIHWMPPDRATTDSFSIVVSSEVLLQTSRHVAQSLERELGGFLLGNRYRCPNTGREYVVIDQYVAAEYTEGTAVSLTFTYESWAHVDDKLTGKFYGKELVGWYHSHPRMSIFLSGHDLTVHRERFADPWMVALVLEPHSHLGGFFAWSDGGRIDPNRYYDFYELLDGSGRESVMAWNNYEVVDPLEGDMPALGAVNTESAEAPGVEPAALPPPPAESHDGLPDWLRGNAKWYATGALTFVLALVVFWPRPPAPTPDPQGGEIVNAGVPENLVAGTVASTQPTPSAAALTPPVLSPEAKRLQERREQEERRRAEEERRRIAAQQVAQQKREEQRRKLQEEREQRRAEQLEKDKARAVELEASRDARVEEMNGYAKDMKELPPDSADYKMKQKLFNAAEDSWKKIVSELKRVTKRLPKTQ